MKKALRFIKGWDLLILPIMKMWATNWANGKLWVGGSLS